jgi:hypothetical protein
LLVHEDDLRRVDPCEIASARRHDCIEPSRRVLDHARSPLTCLLGAGRIRLHDDDLPACELERPCVDPGEAELEHASWSIPDELEDARRRGGCESGRKPSHELRR